MATLITPGDLEMLSWLGRHRFVSAPQVARFSRRPQKVAYRRLAALRERQLVAYERPVLGNGCYWATKDGLALAGIDLRPARVDIRSLFHDRAVVDLALELEACGQVLVTEREMRHADAEVQFAGVGRPRYGLRLPGGGEGGALHYPDLAVELEEGRIRAVEMERLAKNRARLERILTGYARARRVVEVVYYVPGARVGGHVERIAAAVGATPVVSVVVWPGWGHLREVNQRAGANRHG
ncbi:MAG: replication-relaxation family protein [Acidimicrobiia bacterium]